MEVHPLIRSISGYNINLGKDPCYPRFFFYKNCARQIVRLDEQTSKFLEQFLHGQDPITTGIPSRQLVIDGKSFQVGDTVALLKDIRYNSTIFLKIQEILTVHHITIFRGTWFLFHSICPRSGKRVYGRQGLSDWQFPQSIVQIVLIHHRCMKCRIQRNCVHKNCKESCPYSKIELVHDDSNQYFIEENYKNLSC